jgi:hypothetical protein
MKARATFPRIAALILALITGLVTITAAAAAVSRKPATPTQPKISVSSLNKAANIDGYNPMETAVANYMAKKQAEEAAKAAEEAAKQAAATPSGNGGNNSGGGNGGGGGSSNAPASGGSGGGDIYAILDSFGVPGTSIAYGYANGYEACAYYKTGYIVIDPNHTTDLYTLISHEINHILAWRASGTTTE